MVDIGGKPIVSRQATASGEIRLRPSTVAAIRAGRIEKGDVLATARIAGIQAAKRTPELLPLCHPVPLTSVEVDLVAEHDRVRATTTVRAEYRTGVEMEALAGTAAALLTVWDMVKAAEKDARGQYPTTEIGPIRVVEKRKGRRRGRK